MKKISRQWYENSAEGCWDGILVRRFQTRNAMMKPHRAMQLTKKLRCARQRNSMVWTARKNANKEHERMNG
ncbi:hypothetical protein [Polaromonas sp.]|uniref:hypothetical protein n=1 Tax=Polaromonas sp. TaxID=1869339 RepID=UPI00326554D6